MHHVRSVSVRVRLNVDSNSVSYMTWRRHAPCALRACKGQTECR